MPSFDFRLLIRVLGRLSMFSSTTGFVSLLGVSEGVVIALFSSLDGFGAFEDECLRWWGFAGDRFGGPAIGAWDIRAREEHERHVQVLRRMKSLA